MTQYTSERIALLNAAEKASAVCRDWFARASNASAEQRDALLGSQIKSTHYAHYGYEDAFTLADKASEDAILPILRDCRDIMIVSEESCPDCADAPDGTQRWLVDPIDGTSRFKSGKPDFSITLALQTKTNGQWKTDIGMIAVPMEHKIYWADANQSVMQHNGTQTAYSLNADTSVPHHASRQDALRGKTIESIVYSRTNQQLMDTRQRFSEQLTAAGARPINTFSSAKLITEMAGNPNIDGIVMAGNAFDYAWDTDAAIHIAEIAGVHTQRYMLGGQQVMLFAREKPLITALKLQLQEAYAAAGPVIPPRS